MSPDLEKQLCEKYPDLFVNRSKTVHESCLAFSCEHGDGWFELLDCLCLFIQFHIKHNQMPDVTFDQIKEKFGRLTVYYTGGNDRTSGAVALAESMSTRICEACGKPGKLGGTGWLSTLCDECRETLGRKDKTK